MVSSTTWGTSHPVAPVGSHPLPTVPVTGQPCSAVLLSHSVAPYSYILQVMMTPPIRTSNRHLGNTRVYLGNT
jgi:hypothetical protein